MLDQIRLNGESEELKSEVVQLAQSFGIATPTESAHRRITCIPCSWPKPRPAAPSANCGKRLGGVRRLWRRMGGGMLAWAGGMVRRESVAWGMGAGWGIAPVLLGRTTAGARPNDPLHVNDPRSPTRQAGRASARAKHHGGPLTTSRSAKSAIDRTAAGSLEVG